MADATDTTPAEDTTPTVETPVDTAPTDSALTSLEADPNSPENVPAENAPVLQSNIGVTAAQTFGPPAPVSSVALVEETFLAPDRVILDHNDPLANKYQFLGQSDPTPLPLGGANGDTRTAEEKFNS